MLRRGSGIVAIVFAYGAVLSYSARHCRTLHHYSRFVVFATLFEHQAAIAVLALTSGYSGMNTARDSEPDSAAAQRERGTFQLSGCPCVMQL